MARAELGRRGVILLQALVLVMLVALVAVAVVECVFGRFMVVHRVNDAAAKRELARGLQSRVDACLAESSFGDSAALCDLGPYRSCIPRVIEGHPASVTASWSGGRCALSLSVEDN